MANLDISSKLGHEKQEITIAEGTKHEVNCGATNFFKVQEYFSANKIMNALELLLGTNAVKEIEEMELSVKEMEVIIIAAAAQVNEVTYETMEKRFRKYEQ